MKQRREQLQQLDKEALDEGYRLLEDRVRSLEKQVNDLRQLLTSRLPKTPQNSSIPSGQSQKANQKHKAKAQRGPKRGHAGKSRERSEPDEIIECRVAACGHCGADLSWLPQHEVGRHQVIDIPPMRPLVREGVRYGRYCPQCETYQRAEAPRGFERGRRVGLRLERLVLYLHYAHPLSDPRVQRILAEVCGIQLSEGTLVNLVQRAKAGLERGAQAIHPQIKQSNVIGSDETTTRVDGKTHWQWVFQTPTLAY